MTEYKEQSNVPKQRSLYVGLLYNIARGLIFAIVGWLLVMITSYYFIAVNYTTPERQTERHAEYILDLQSFVNKNSIDEKASAELADWVRENPYVYLIIYYENHAPAGSDHNDTQPREFTGSRIDESIDRAALVEAAISRGYHKILLADNVQVTVALAEYTENLYYTTFNVVSVAAAMLIFTMSLVQYIRVIIDRIKRFESDVTIVSEIDMGYQIVSEGDDEISTLSGKVEQMRQRMLSHIKSEQEARETNAELLSSISHDIRTPLTVLMGYIEMMKEHGEQDELMTSYISATESTALRLKQLSDDMFRFSLAFGDVEKLVNLEEYDARTLFEQLFAEHFVLMREMGYDIRLERVSEELKDGSIIRTDAPNLMRIVDNVFSNLRKYADKDKPIVFSYEVRGDRLIFECKNSILVNDEKAESHGIGLKTCKRLGSLIADKFEYAVEGDLFISRLYVPLRNNKE